MFVIEREKGHTGNFPSFKTVENALAYLNENVGLFEINEIIALVDYTNAKFEFVKLASTVIPVVLEK